MGDEEDLKAREEELKRDKMEQALWYESLNLYGEAMRIYNTLKDTRNIDRLREKISEDYMQKAKDMEMAGRYQDAANLYYLVGDSGSVKRMRTKDPSLVILYDEKAGGLSQLGTGIDLGTDNDGTIPFFKRPNEGPEDGQTKARPAETLVKPGRSGLPVRIPKKQTARFCPYCGEQMSTKKEPRFCPFCGEEL
jgi:hypothetical protein